MEDTSVMLQLQMRDAIRRERLLSPDDVVLVAFSGGADSTALLHSLCAYRDEGGIAAVKAAHIHHGLRGDEADADEQSVIRFCASLGVELFCHHADVHAIAATRKCGVEEAGRAVRYAFLQEMAEKCGAKIATAHTLNDQVETVLLHMVRGCGLRGLTGMPIMRDNIVRPLLSCTREMVEAYCETNGLPFVTDSTNASDLYARNRLRAAAIPSLLSVNDGALSNIERLTWACREDDEYLTSLADAFIVAHGEHPERTAMQQLPVPVQKRVWMRLAPMALSYNRLEALCASAQDGCAVSLPNGVNAVWQGRPQRLYWIENDVTENGEEILLNSEMSFRLAGNSYRFQVFPIQEIKKYQKIHKKDLNYTFDYDKICGSLAVRTRRTGDYIHPVGRRVGKSIKKWMIEKGIPAFDRDAIPVVCDEKGIVLVVGLGCDERVCLDEKTQRVAMILIEDFQ